MLSRVFLQSGLYTFNKNLLGDSKYNQESTIKIRTRVNSWDLRNKALITIAGFVLKLKYQQSVCDSKTVGIVCYDWKWAKTLMWWMIWLPIFGLPDVSWEEERIENHEIPVALRNHCLQGRYLWAHSVQFREITAKKCSDFDSFLSAFFLSIYLWGVLPPKFADLFLFMFSACALLS